MGQEAVGFRLDTYNCSHFLRQEIDGLQLRNLQSASCLPSKMEVTAVIAIVRVIIWQGQRRAKPCLSKRLRDLCSPCILGTSDTPERLLGVKSQGIILGHNESSFSQKPSLWDQSCPRCACEPQGRVLKQINLRGDKWDDQPEGRQRPRKLPPYKGFKLNQRHVTVSLSSLVCLSLCTFLFNKLFLFTFFLAWIHS